MSTPARPAPVAVDPGPRYFIVGDQGLLATHDGTQDEAEYRAIVLAVNGAGMVHLHDRLTELLPGTSSAAQRALEAIEAGRPCLDADTTSSDLAYWARTVVIPVLERQGLL